VPHRIVARRPHQNVAAAAIEREPEIVASFLSDAAHVPGGYASGVAFPRDEAAYLQLALKLVE